MRKLEEWTGTVIGTLHIYSISHNEFAERLGMNPKYMSSLLNGHAKPKGTEARFLKALAEVTAEKEAEIHAQNQIH